MSTFTEIQAAIVQLTDSERNELFRWLERFEEDDWDRQITVDASSGKLDFMTKEAEQAKRDGKLLPLPLPDEV